jgi:hypothetical protein
VASGAYTIGREETELSTAESSYVDKLFASQRLDNQTFENKAFKHCTFANISFKDSKFKDVRFEDCVFIECYFRNSQIKNCFFAACRFIDCNMTKIDIRTTDLKYYNSFQGCMVPFNELSESLPSEGNLRAHLCQNLAAEARIAGAYADSEKYQQEGARGMRRHLYAVFTHSSEFHREKYQTSERIGAFFQWLGIHFRSIFWGYRRSYLVVLRNWLVVTLVLFPIIFKFLGDQLRPNDSWTDRVLASLGNMLPGEGISNVEYLGVGAQLWAFTEVLIGLIFIGLVITLLFRAVYERRQL